MEARRSRIQDGVISRELDGETVVLNLETGFYYGLNAVGTRIWRGLAAGLGNEELQALIVKEFEVFEATAAYDLQNWLRELEAKRLIDR